MRTKDAMLSPQITFRHMKASESVAERIREEAAKLQTYYDRIMSCRVVVYASHQHHQRGNPYHIGIDLGVPGGEIVVGHEPGLRAIARKTGEEKKAKDLEVELSHKDIYVAIRDAFDSARRQLQDYADRQRRRKDTPGNQLDSQEQIDLGSNSKAQD